MNIQELTVSERILLAERLWESVSGQSASIEITDAQKHILDERLAALDIDGELGDSWDVVKNRITKS
jgi:putative addiction module component (TIGR02574 family)